MNIQDFEGRVQLKDLEDTSLHSMYDALYKFMIQKDAIGLSELLDDNFVLVHMTGMKQNKTDFIRAITGGTLNYYSYENTRLTISVLRTEATLVGKSEVNAAVFGGERHTWPLQLSIQLYHKGDKWLMRKAIVETY